MKNLADDSTSDSTPRLKQPLKQRESFALRQSLGTVAGVACVPAASYTMGSLSHR